MRVTPRMNARTSLRTRDWMRCSRRGHGPVDFASASGKIRAARGTQERATDLMRQIVLDTETTGLEPAAGHRVIEIGCVELVNRRPTQNRFHRYVNPDREVDRAALEVHGIENEFLATQPRFAEIAREFVEFVKGAQLVIHNADFDVEFL